MHPEREIVSCNASSSSPDDGFLSVGIHPWTLTEENADTQWQTLRKAVEDKQVVAIGEGGLDKIKGPSFELQLSLLKKQIALSEEKELPLILHCVKAFNELIRLKRELKPRQPWILHGFRGKEALAADCVRHGFHLSFGEHFQKEALKCVPIERLFIETDESRKPVESICESIAEVRRIYPDELKENIYKNVKNVFFKA